MATKNPFPAKALLTLSRNSDDPDDAVLFAARTPGEAANDVSLEDGETVEVGIYYLHSVRKLRRRARVSVR